MGSVNELNPKIDLTVRVFDDFYNFELEVDSNEYDVVYSYFRSIYTNDTAAANFTTTLFRISSETRVPVLTLLAQIQDMNSVELTSTLAYYLNGLRSPTTLLGINEPVVPNYYTARNILP